MNRRNNASSLLQKASLQLSGKKAPQSRNDNFNRSQPVGSDEEIDNYLSTLGTRGSMQDSSRRSQYRSVDDISVSSDDASLKFTNTTAGSGSKFLKKKDTAPVEPETGGSKFLKKSRPALNSSQTHSNFSDQKHASSALNRVASLTNKYSKIETPTKSRADMAFSDSDLDMDISQDSDVVADVKAMKNRNLSFTKTTPAKPASSSIKMKNSQVLMSSDEDLENLEGSRFLKKKPQVSGVQQDMGSNSGSESSFVGRKSFLKTSAQKKGQSSLLQDVGPKTSTPIKKMTGAVSESMVFDSSEEDLADFIQGLSTSSEDTRLVQERNVVTVITDSEPESFNQGKKFIKSQPTVVAVEDTSESVQTRTPSPVDSSDGSAVQVMDINALRSVEDSVHSEVMSDVLSIASEVSSDDEKGNANVLGQFGLSTLDDFDDSPPVAKPKPAVRNSKAKPTPKSTQSASVFNKLGLSTLDDLDDSPPTAKQKPQSTSVFNTLGLSTMDDLEVVAESPDLVSTARTADKYASDFESAIDTARTESAAIETARPESVTTVASVSEVRTASPTKSYVSDKDDSYSVSSRSGVSSSSKTNSDSASSYTKRSKSSSVDTVKSVQETDDESKTVTDSYTKDFSSASQTTKTSDFSKQSESRTVSYSSRTESTSHVRSKKTKKGANNKKTKSVEIQTSEPAVGLSYAWNAAFVGQSKETVGLGLGYTDPTPIASTVVNADALEAMTAYSPAALALNDMLRQQLSLTRNFMEIQQRAYVSSMETLQPDYTYTTLEDTKQYIKQKRKQPLNFKDALKQVKEEMGL